MVRLTEPEGSVVWPNLAEPPSSADTDADSSVVHYRSGGPSTCLGKMNMDQIHINPSDTKDDFALRKIEKEF